MVQVTQQVGDKARARCQIFQLLVSGFQLVPQLDYRLLEGWKQCLLSSTQTTTIARHRLPVVPPSPSMLPEELGVRPLQLRARTCAPSRLAPGERAGGCPAPSFPPSLAGKLRASISLLIALIRDRGGVNWKTLVLCLFGEENVNKN